MADEGESVLRIAVSYHAQRSCLAGTDPPQRLPTSWEGIESTTSYPAYVRCCSLHDRGKAVPQDLRQLYHKLSMS
jgi:hypothetical protein